MCVDKQTVDYYSSNSNEMAEVYQNALHDLQHGRLRSLVSPGQRILDVGCASGQDVAFLNNELGVEADGVDPVHEFVEYARRRFPNLSNKFRVDSLPQLETCRENSYDGAIAWAVLMHLDQETIGLSLTRLSEVLRPSAFINLLIPNVGRPTSEDSRDRETGRLYSGVTPEFVGRLLMQYDFRLESVNSLPDALGRAELSWWDITYRR